MSPRRRGARCRYAATVTRVAQTLRSASIDKEASKTLTPGRSPRTSSRRGSGAALGRSGRGPSEVRRAAKPPPKPSRRRSQRDPNAAKRKRSRNSWPRRRLASRARGTPGIAHIICGEVSTAQNVTAPSQRPGTALTEDNVAKNALDRSATATADRAPAAGALAADIIIANAPTRVVSDLEGKILQANDAVSELLGFRRDEVLEQSLSRFISEEETREFTAALKEVVERGVTRNAVLNPRSATGEVIPTSLNASALRDEEGNVIGAIGVLRDMRELDKARAYAQSLIENAQDPVFVADLEERSAGERRSLELLGFRRDEVVEQSLSPSSAGGERGFTAALRRSSSTA